VKHLHTAWFWIGVILAVAAVLNFADNYFKRPGAVIVQG
jgi:hypothetical protein